MKPPSKLMLVTKAAVVRRQRPQKAKFLRELARIPSVVRAAKCAGVNRTRVYLWRKDDPEFAAAWKEAIDVSIDRVEAGALEFVLSRPTEATASAWVNMVKYMLSAHKPDTYRERIENAVIGGIVLLPAKAQGDE